MSVREFSGDRYEKRLSVVAAFEGLHSIEISDAGVTVVADCMYVTGTSPGSAPSEGRNPRPSKGPEAEQPVPRKRGKKPL